MEHLQELEQQMARGHCAESQTDIHNTRGDIGKLVQCYFYYIKQCVQKGFPSLAYMRQHLGERAAKYGGYIDTTGEVQPQRDMAFIGDCNCTFTAGGYNIHRVWLQHNSQLTAVATDHSHLHIDCFGDSQLILRMASPTAKAWVNLYGDSKCTIEGNADNVIINKHNKATY